MPVIGRVVAPAAAAVELTSRERALRRPARLIDPQSPVRLQGHLRPFSGGRPGGEPNNILTGFVNGDGKAMGRPVGVAIDTSGALLVADDVGNKVLRVLPKGQGR